jgi:hypothetical protein
MIHANMIHASLRWPDCPIIDFWPLAMSYAIWVLPCHMLSGCTTRFFPVAPGS